jgi:hypothetical protein
MTSIYPAPSLVDQVRDFALDVITLPELFRNTELLEGIVGYAGSVVPVEEVKKEVLWVAELMKEGITCPYGLFNIFKMDDDRTSTNRYSNILDAATDTTTDVIEAVYDVLDLVTDKVYEIEFAERVGTKMKETLETAILYTAATVGLGFMAKDYLFKPKEDQREKRDPPKLSIVRG